MKLTFENSKFYITCGYGERDQIKQVGFRWDSDKKMWGSNNIFIVVNAIKQLGLTDIPNQALQYLNNIVGSKRSKCHNKKQAHLFPYQAAGVEEIAKRNGVLLADEQGLGKTLQTIQFINEMPRTHILIVCPASLKLNWEREFKKWSEIPYSTRVITNGKDNFLNDRSPLTGRAYGTIIVNYDLLKSKIIMDQLIKFSPKILVCDEAHYLKNAKTQRTKNIAKLAKLATKKIFITGTPMLNRPIELHSILKMLSPETIKPYLEYRHFAYRFCNAYNSKWGLDVSGNSNVEELNVRLRATCMIRRLKKDVLEQLPDKTTQVIPFELCKKTKKIIEREEWYAVDDLQSYPQRGNMGELAEIRHELALAKLDESARYISDLLESIDKVVVFAYHHDVINGLKEKLEEFNPVVLTGKHNIKSKQKAVDDFQNEEDVRVFIGQIQAAGTGLTLTAASNVVFVESSWVPGEINQAIDRCHRIGQKDNVTAKFLVVEKSLDETMLKSIFEKTKTINKVLK